MVPVHFVSGKIKRKNVTSISMTNGRKIDVLEFQGACPVKWTGPDLRASTSAIAFESLELVHRGLDGHDRKFPAPLTALLLRKF